MKNKTKLFGVLGCFVFLSLFFIGCNKDNNVGVFTLTGIPINYENKYVLLVDGRDENIIGVDKINSYSKDFLSMDVILTKIINGKANIPLWNADENNTRYSGNHTFSELVILVLENQALTDDSDNEQLEERSFYNITFENGNAKCIWTDGEEYK